MKAILEQDLMNMVQRIEKQAVYDALDEVLSQLNRKADMIEHLLYSEVGWQIYQQSSGKMAQLMFEQRRLLRQKIRAIYEIAGFVYEIQRPYL